MSYILSSSYPENIGYLWFLGALSSTTVSAPFVKGRVPFLKDKKPGTFRQSLRKMMMLHIMSSSASFTTYFSTPSMGEWAGTPSLIDKFFLKKDNFVEKVEVLMKMRFFRQKMFFFSAKIGIFQQNYNFLANVAIFRQKWECSTKMVIFLQSGNFSAKMGIFWQKWEFFGKK